MNNKIQTLSLVIGLFIVLFVFDFDILAQITPTTEMVSTDAKPKTDTTAPSPVPAPVVEPGFWEREELFGNLGELRSQMKDSGVEMELKLTQFYQGIAAGGLNSASEYNGKFQTTFHIDLEKLAGFKHWSMEFKTDTRFGGPLLTGVGAINPVNTDALIPKPRGTAFAITALNFTRIFPIDLQKGDLIAVSFGRYNLLDLIVEDFFAGGGTTRFLNLAQNGPLTAIREVPLVTNGINFAYVRKGEPFITLSLLDPNDHSTDPGLSDLFEDGISIGPGINFPTKYFNKTGKHTIGAFVTTKKYTPFDAIKQLLIPGPPINPIEPQRGSFSITYTFRQYLVERAKHNGWGFFGQVSFANEDTSPISSFVNVGIGGNGLIKSRTRDQFGIAYSYTGISKELKDNLDLSLFRRLRAEHQAEIFYNLHITPWLRLSGDIQIIQPTRPSADTAVVPAVRLEIIF